MQIVFKSILTFIYKKNNPNELREPNPSSVIKTPTLQPSNYYLSEALI